MSMGPRLDRPSAIGDEGRARAASLALASVVLLGVILAVAYTSSLWKPVQTTLLGAGLVVGGMGLLRREKLSAMAMGQLMFLPGGVVTMGGIATGALSGGSPIGNVLFLFGVSVATIGLGGAWANADYESTLAATKQGWGAVLVPFVGLIVLGLVATVAFFVFRISVSGSIRGTASLSGFFFLLGLTILAIRLAVDKLPITELTDRERRDEIERRRERWQRAATRAGAIAFALWLVVGLVEGFNVVSRYNPLYRSLSSVFGSPLVRVPLFAVGALALLAVLVAWILRRVTRERAGSTLIAPVVGGIALLGIPGPILLLLARGLSAGGDRRLTVLGLVIAAAVVIAAVLFMFVFSLGPIAVNLDLLPDRAGAIALASAGALLAGAGAALTSVRPALAYATVAAAMIAWDSSAFGLGLTAELGHIPDTRRLELVHGVAALAIGGVAVALTTGLDLAFRAVSPTEPILSAMVLAVGGVLLLLAPLRS